MRRRLYLKQEETKPDIPTKPITPDSGFDQTRTVCGFGFKLADDVETDGLTKIHLSFTASKYGNEDYIWGTDIDFNGSTYNDIFAWFANDDQLPFDQMTQNINDCSCVINNVTLNGSIMMMPETVVYGTPFMYLNITDVLTKITVYTLHINHSSVT